MRIRLVTEGKYSFEGGGGNFAESLGRELEDRDDVALTSDNPDIIHIFGNWDMASLRIVRKARKQGILTVFTSVKGLAAFSHDNTAIPNPLQTICLHAIAANVCTIHTCGPMEQQIIRCHCKKAETRLIANPFLTSATNKQRMATEMMHLYEDIIRQRNMADEEKADSQMAALGDAPEAISGICRHIISIKIMLRNNKISQASIDELTEAMTNSNYDEEGMRTAMKHLGIYNFSRALMYVMNRKSSLTEGFMPVEPADNKLAGRILSSIK